MSYKVRRWRELELLEPTEERGSSGAKRVLWKVAGLAWCGFLELRFFDLLASTFAGEGSIAKAVVRTTIPLGPEWRLRSRDGAELWEVTEVTGGRGIDVEVALRKVGAQL